MNKHKRLLSFLLALVMVLGMFPLSAIASDDSAVTCTECGAESGHIVSCSQYEPPKCDECGLPQVGELAGHSSVCSQYQGGTSTTSLDEEEPEDTTGNTTESTGNTTESTGSTTESTGNTDPSTQPSSEATDPSTQPSTEVTDPSTQPSSEATDPSTQPSSEATDPSTEPSTEATTVATTVPAEAPLCDKCTATKEGDKVIHNDGCPNKPLCDICGTIEKNEDGTPKHAEKCETLCTCTVVDGKHQDYCVLYVNALCETCGMEVCVCEMKSVYLLKGAEIYKDYTDANETPKVIDKWNTSIKIKASVTAEDGTEWYEFAYASFWAELFNGYKFVKVEDTTEFECSCNSVDGVHSEECTLYLGGELVAAESVEYSGTTNAGLSASVFASENAFPEGTVMTVSDTTVDMGIIDAAVNGSSNFMLRRSAPTNSVEILGVKAIDISFGGEQPSEPVTLQMSIPDSDIPEDANMIIVVHLGEYGPEVVLRKYLRTDVDVHNVAMTVNGFSDYAAVFANANYQPQLMRDVIANDPEYKEKYSIAEFNVNLFDYDPVAFNNANGVASDVFHFVGTDLTAQTGASTNTGINDSTATYAKQGIVKDTLVNGLPEFNYEVEGKDTASALFSTTPHTGKTVYNNIPFEFVFNKDTGWYEYKSSANHAQYNSATGKVELYADTLSTEQERVHIVDVSNPTGLGDITITSNENNHIKATVSDAVTPNSRLDPYFSIIIPDDALWLSPELYTSITLDVKVPASIGKSTCKIYYSNETHVIGEGTTEKPYYIWKAYEPTGDWITISIPTSEDWRTSSVIKSIRIDLFDTLATQNIEGANSSTANTSNTYDVEIRNVKFIGHAVSEHSGRGGFYPFTDISSSFPQKRTFAMTEWEDAMEDHAGINYMATRSMGNPALGTSALREELYLGVVMEFPFYLPVDKKVNEDDPLRFYFNGDDDLWVFVDGKLALDIGGGHGAITGYIDFTNGTWQVDNAITVDGYASNKNDEGLKSGTLAKALTNPGKHTIKMFYLERCGSVSNCYIRFNLPQTPQGAVVVSKQVSEKNNADLDVLKDVQYPFTISTKNLGADTDNQFHDYAKQSFIIMDKTTAITSEATTGPNGEFLLKHNQEAYFDINENHEVKITESQINVEGYDFVSVEINGTKLTDVYEWIQSIEQKKEFRFDFVNTYDEKEVTYTYIPVNPTGCPDDKKGTVELTGDTSSATYAEAGVTETVGVAVFNPAGSTATGNNAVKFVGWYSNKECTELVTEEFAIVPQKPVADTEGKYSGVTFYAKFEFLYGNLTIYKSGISIVDDHPGVSGSNFIKEEQQSTVYRVLGRSAACNDPDKTFNDIDMEVVLVGDDASVTIRDIPVGNYTVTEIVDWSWRYDAVDADIDVTIEGGKTSIAAFENTRPRKQWLSGDNYRLNLFNKVNAGTTE